MSNRVCPARLSNISASKVLRWRLLPLLHLRFLLTEFFRRSDKVINSSYQKEPIIITERTCGDESIDDRCLGHRQVIPWSSGDPSWGAVDLLHRQAMPVTEIIVEMSST